MNSTQHPTLNSKNKTQVSGFGSQGSSKDGSALIVALWVLIILSLLIGGFAFGMHIEAGITSYYRKRMKCQYLSQAGVEWAKYLLAKSSEVGGAFDDVDLEEEMLDVLEPLSRGVGVSMSKELGAGGFTVEIKAEESRRNVNGLSDEDWEELLDQGNVPEELWPEMIDCFADWVDDNDEHHLNGAESDDPFYKERGYEVKNAKVDTIDELVLIKHFSQEIVYGGQAEDENDEPYPGIAQWLTVWGNGKVNVNTASREVLMTLPGVTEIMVDDLIIGRSGLDQEMGTRDDGFESIDDAASYSALPAEARSQITTSDTKFLRVVSMGEVDGIRSGVWCVLKVDGDNVTPVFWREEMMP